MAGPIIQSEYRQYPDIGYPGLLARPEEPTIIERGVLGGSGTFQPGDALFWDRTNLYWRLSASAAEANDTTGILSYDQSTVQNTSDAVRFEAGDEVRVGIMGTFFATAGESFVRGDRVIFDTSDHKWNRQAAFAVPAATATPAGVAQASQIRDAIQAAIPTLVNGAVEGGLSGALFTCVSRSVSDGDLFMVRVSFGVGTPIVY